MENKFQSMGVEVPIEVLKKAVVIVKIPGQPEIKYKAPVIISQIENNRVNGKTLGVAPREVMLAILSMINIFRSMASIDEKFEFNDLLCNALDEISGDIINGIVGDIIAGGVR